MFSWNIHTVIVTAGFRDKIFNTETVATLVRAISNEESKVRISVVEIFTAAIAQGAPSSFHGIFMLKYLQRAFNFETI